MKRADTGQYNRVRQFLVVFPRSLPVAHSPVQGAFLRTAESAGIAAGDSTVLQGGGLPATNLYTAVNDGAITRLGSREMPVNGHERTEDAGFRKPYFVAAPV